MTRISTSLFLAASLPVLSVTAFADECRPELPQGAPDRSPCPGRAALWTCPLQCGVVAGATRR